MLGLFAFFYACLHFTTYIWLDQFFDWLQSLHRGGITIMPKIGACLRIDALYMRKVHARDKTIFVHNVVLGRLVVKGKPQNGA